MILAEVESATGRRTAHLFDVMAGTSTGALIVGALNVSESDQSTDPKYRAQQIVDLYKDDIPKIFHSTTKEKLESLVP